MALCGARGGDLRAADSSAPIPPLGCKSQKFGWRGGGVNIGKVYGTVTELCSFDSESSEKKILLIEYVFIFCGLPTLLIVGSVYPPLNTDHTVSLPETPSSRTDTHGYVARRGASLPFEQTYSPGQYTMPAHQPRARRTPSAASHFCRQRPRRPGL